jgi:hypothetical protein
MSDYSAKAQPYLNVIAANVFLSQVFRDWLIVGTPAEAIYQGSSVLVDEQRAVRWRRKPTKQPFWSNYHCGLDAACKCRIPESKALESDAIFYFQNVSGRTLALHIEFKHRSELLKYGQSEAYPLRAMCFQERVLYGHPYSIAHDDWALAIFCDEDSLNDPRVQKFQRKISHVEAAEMMKHLGYVSWPSALEGTAFGRP